MAHATHITIATCDRIRLGADALGVPCCHEDHTGDNGIRQEVQVSITYALETGDTDVIALAEQKALQVQLAHEAVWKRIGSFRRAAQNSQDNEPEGPQNGSNGHNGNVAMNGHACQTGNGISAGNDHTPTNGNHAPSHSTQGRATSRAGKRGKGLSTVETAPSATHPGTPANRASGSVANGNGQTAVAEQNGSPPLEKTYEPLANAPQKIAIRSRAAKIGLSSYALEQVLFQQFRKWSLDRLTKSEASSLLQAMQRDEWPNGDEWHTENETSLPH